MANSGRTRRFSLARSGEERRRVGLAALGAFAASLLPACSGCQVDIERSSDAAADGLFRGVLVGGTEPDGPFVVARREAASGDGEVVLVSLAEDEKRTCSLGKAFYYTMNQQPWPGYSGEEPHVDARQARILTLEGDLGAKSGDLRIFDASCTERIRVPSVKAPVWPTLTVWPIYNANLNAIEAYAAQTTAGQLVWIDPWASTTRTIAENTSFWKYQYDKFWLIEGGKLFLRDRDGEILQTAGTGVTEISIAPLGDEMAYVDENGLWVLKLGEDVPTAIPTKGTPCKPEYLWSNPRKLAYRDDCAAGVLAVQDRTTGDTRVFSSNVTSVTSRSGPPISWILFEREEPGKKRELWVVPGADEPVLVGTGSRLDKGFSSYKEGFLFILDHDGTTGKFGKWTQEGGFSPLVEGFVGQWPHSPYLTTLGDAEADGNVGTLVIRDQATLAEILSIPRVHRLTPHFSQQAPALGYIHDWDDKLKAGTFTTWIPYTAQQIDVDTGVAEFDELVWPKPGVIYAVRTPGREGLWTAYPDL